MAPMTAWTLLGFGLTVSVGFLCVRMLERRDVQRLVQREQEQQRRHPQMRLFY